MGIWETKGPASLNLASDSLSFMNGYLATFEQVCESAMSAAFPRYRLPGQISPELVSTDLKSADFHPTPWAEVVLGVFLVLCQNKTFHPHAVGQPQDKPLGGR